MNGKIKRIQQYAFDIALVTAIKHSIADPEFNQSTINQFLPRIGNLSDELVAKASRVYFDELPFIIEAIKTHCKETHKLDDANIQRLFESINMKLPIFGFKQKGLVIVSHFLAHVWYPYAHIIADSSCTRVLSNNIIPMLSTNHASEPDIKYKPDFWIFALSVWYETYIDEYYQSSDEMKTRLLTKYKLILWNQRSIRKLKERHHRDFDSLVILERIRDVRMPY